MHHCVYIIPSVIFATCFIEKIKLSYFEYKIEQMTDCLVEIDNSRITPNTASAISLVENDSNIYELNNNNRVRPRVPFDNVMIQ
tara:strand:+ start:132 stop:383 length:252 start_codon:yes stop_codon:yes gene_type:complete